MLTIETALEWIDADELVEVTPEHVRVRKRILQCNLRPRREEAIADAQAVELARPAPTRAAQPEARRSHELGPSCFHRRAPRRAWGVPRPVTGNPGPAFTTTP